MWDAGWLGGDWIPDPGDPPLAWAPEVFAPAAAMVRSGRLALARAIASVVPPGATVLMPALGCPALAQAARAAGTRPAFYPSTTRLAPRWSAVTEIARRLAAQAVLVVHPAGWLLEDARAELAGGGGIALIEDASFTLMNAAAAITLGPRVTAAAAASLRKVLPLPSGGAWLRWGHPPVGEPAAAPDRFAAARLGALSRPGGPERHRLLTRAERFLDAEVAAGGIPAETEALLQVLARASGPLSGRWRARTRANWLQLTQELAPTACRPVFGDLPPGICPAGVVVRHPDRSALARHLLTCGIEATLHFPVSAEAKSAMDGEERRLAATLLTLPCDGRYGSAEMERIARACLGYDLRRS